MADEQTGEVFVSGSMAYVAFEDEKYPRLIPLTQMYRRNQSQD